MSRIDVGFSGTQQGMTMSQSRTLRAWLDELTDGYSNCVPVFHHGDCIGADAQAHGIAVGLGFAVVLHPPIIKDKRAFCTGCSAVKKPKDYLVRNRDIVDASGWLVATPKTAEEELRSGTWSTVRYAAKMKRELVIIDPRGNMRRAI